MQARFLGRRLFLFCRGDLVRISIGRMMTEMLGGATGFMLAIGRDRAPAELECKNRKHEKDEASGGHSKSIAWALKAVVRPRTSWHVRASLTSLRDACLMSRRVVHLRPNADAGLSF